LRHAEAEDGTPDEQRRLTPHGEEQARAAGAALVALGVQVSACVSSPRVRAVQTARLACEPQEVDVVEDRRLEGGPFDPREVSADGGSDVLLVGHDPDFSMALHRLTGAQVRLKKGGLAGLDRGELKVLLRPSDLKALATKR
jgi:phosphohistidine phosphatase